MKRITFICLTVLLIQGHAVPLYSPASRQHRESTPEILDLEQQLKAQAGEDKQASSPVQHPVPVNPVEEDTHLPPLKPVNNDNEDHIDEALFDELKAAARHGEGAVPAQLIPEMSAVNDDVLKEDDVADEEALINASQDIGQKDALVDEAELVPEVASAYENKINDFGGLEQARYMNDVLQTFREHPEMFRQMLQDELWEERQTAPQQEYEHSPADFYDAVRAETEGAVQRPLDYNQREAEEEAERALAGEELSWPINFNPYQEHNGDALAREVAKKRGYGPPEVLENQVHYGKWSDLDDEKWNAQLAANGMADDARDDNVEEEGETHSEEESEEEEGDEEEEQDEEEIEEEQEDEESIEMKRQAVLPLVPMGFMR